ncbi:response regulator [Actinomadura roseirufa]|uniref:response regulator n=1 Tax=Actinomadura roseirufa TaxID=2094049 RepID=UPI001041AF19|nr:response regulator transcription factor [Actinomadura roseirufa]
MDEPETSPRVLVADDNVVVRSGLVSLLEANGIEVVAEAGDGGRAVELAERLRPDVVLLDVRMPLMDGVTAAAALSASTRVLMLTYTDDPDVIRAALARGASGYLVHGAFTADELVTAVRQTMLGAHPLSPAAVAALVTAVRGDAGGRAGDGRSADRHAHPRADLTHDPHEDLRTDPRDERRRHEPPARPVAPVRRDRFGLSARESEVMRLIVQGVSNGEIAGRLFLAEKTVKNHVNRIYAKLGVTSRAAAIARWLGTSEDPR